ncbi:AI-2E family transporter [bacterium]|nr:MAG: AI-2E family transporter [bacterium]
MPQHRSNPERLKRSRIFYSLLVVFIVLIISMLIWALNALILPVIIGLISAYIAMPALNWLIRQRVPKAAGVAILFGGFIFVVFVIGRQVISLFPDEKEQLELRVNIQYKIHENFSEFLASDSTQSGVGMVNILFGQELKPMFTTVTGFLSLNEEEEAKLFKYGVYSSDNAKPIKPSTIRRYDELKKLGYSNIGNTEKKNEAQIKQFNPLGISPGNSRIAALLSAISNWLITPFVFIFVLFDDGEIKQFLFDLVPNRYFEMALTTADNVDKAIGGYLRGTLLESTLVGLSFILGLLIVGFDLQAALMIGIVAGIANAIPFLGPVIGLVVGVSYALIVENIDPIIPFLSGDNAIVAVVITVAVVQLLDNAYFSPVILGKAVNLHPLVVILGVSGGSILFGFIGMLFAIPTIVIMNVIISTLYKQLKAYYIIY